MDWLTFRWKRWTVVYGRYEGVEAYAVNEIASVIQRHVPYIVVLRPDNVTEELLKGTNVLLIGTNHSNAYIRKLIAEGHFEPNINKEGYTIKVMQSPFDSNYKIAVIGGADENGALYGVRDFEHYYVAPTKYRGEYYNKRHEVFLDEMPDIEILASPLIEHRGLWTWGHAIYDYKHYIDNMSRWKMNTLTIWNDFAPVNIREVVNYAHSRGVQVLFGYSWCWGEEVNPKDPEQVEYWQKRVLEIYETQYQPVHPDGIYFQIFTEFQGSTMLDGESTAKLAVEWVNRVAAPLLDRYPGLWVQFGLHGTGVINDLDMISKVDKRLAIVWEDIGSFPFHYVPSKTEEVEETLALCDRIVSLRGDEEDFGVIIKSMPTLHWPSFEHQRGPFVLGESHPRFIRDRARAKEDLWLYKQTYWVKNLEYVMRTMRSIANGRAFRKCVMGLLEDGLWEDRTWLAGALLAEAMWNPLESPDELLRKVMLTGEAAFA
jgi:hypothetical protein